MWTSCWAKWSNARDLRGVLDRNSRAARQMLRYQPFAPASFATVSDALDNTGGIQNRYLDWGDGRSLRLTWRPDGSPWSVSAGVRYGRTNGGTHRQHEDVLIDPNTCAFPANFGTNYGFPVGYIAYAFCNPNGAKYSPFASHYPVVARSDVSARDDEDHHMVDFAVGYDVGIGGAFSASQVSAGLRGASFESSTRFEASALDNWNVPEGWAFVTSTADEAVATLSASRKFKGAGPVLSWDAAVRLLGSEQTGNLALDWSVTGGALFGDRKTQVLGQERLRQVGTNLSNGLNYPIPTIGTPTTTIIDESRSESATVPLVDLSLGLAYEVGRVRVGAGYRWERYFNVLDVGTDEAKDGDRTLDGPYFKIAVGFGG